MEILKAGNKSSLYVHHKIWYFDYSFTIVHLEHVGKDNGKKERK